MNRRLFCRTAGLTALAVVSLGACGQNIKQPQVSNEEAYALAANAHGFSPGPVMAANTVYVFFDALCPHCSELWSNAKPLAHKLRMVWIPVALLSSASMPQGAAILAAGDPIQAMNAHEKIVQSGKRTALPAVATPSAEIMRKMQENTEILMKLGVSGVPFTLYKNAKDGRYAQWSGLMDTMQMQTAFGI